MWNLDRSINSAMIFDVILQTYYFFIGVVIKDVVPDSFSVPFTALSGGMAVASKII